MTSSPAVGRWNGEQSANFCCETRELCGRRFVILISLEKNSEGTGGKQNETREEAGKEDASKSEVWFRTG